MKAKSILSLSIAAMMTISLLAGCGTAKKEGPTSTPINKPSATAAAKRGKITATIYDRGTIPASEGTIDNNRWTKWINENGPVDVTFVPIPRVNPIEKISLLFASGTAPDIIFNYSDADLNTLYNQKLLLPINDMVNKYSTTYKKMLADYPSLGKLVTKEDGKMYGFCRISETMPFKPAAIRIDWLKKLKLDMPKTTDDVLKVAKAFKEQDPDGNGKADTMAIALPGNFGATGVANWFMIDQMDDTYSYPTNRMKAAITFFKEAFNNGYIDRDFLLDKNNAKAKAAFSSGMAGIYSPPSGVTGFARDELATLVKNVPTAEIAFMLPPKTSEGQFYPWIAEAFSSIAYINANTKDPEAVMKYMDWQSSNEPLKGIKYGVEGIHSKKNADGTYTILDADKFKNEVSSYASDFHMPANTPLAGSAFMSVSGFSRNIPSEKMFMDSWLSVCKEVAASTEMKPYYATPYAPSWPIPKEITQTFNQVRVQLLEEIPQKSIVMQGMTVDQAMKDIKDVYDKSGVTSYYDFMKDYAKKNAASVVPFKDNLDVFKKQLVDIEKVITGK